MTSPHQTALKLQNALSNTHVVSFVSAVLEQKYQYHFQGHKRVVSKMIQSSMQSLVKACASGELAQDYTKVSQRIHKLIYRSNGSIWFNEAYRKYKIKTTPYYDYLFARPFLKGPDVLDFGGGAGYFALELKKHKYNVFIADVLDYRIKEVKEFSFQKMKNPTDLEYKHQHFNSAIARTVLHHIDTKTLPIVLSKLHKVTERLIILEDVYGLEDDKRIVQADIPSQKNLRIFMKFTPREQKDILMLFDFYGNSIAQGVYNMNFPFDFKRVEEWCEILGTNKWTVSSVETVGFDIHNLHRPAQAWIICDH